MGSTPPPIIDVSIWIAILIHRSRVDERPSWLTHSEQFTRTVVTCMKIVDRTQGGKVRRSKTDIQPLSYDVSLVEIEVWLF